jgi:hypothetical protein
MQMFTNYMLVFLSQYHILIVSILWSAIVHKTTQGSFDSELKTRSPLAFQTELLPHADQPPVVDIWLLKSTGKPCVAAMEDNILASASKPRSDIKALAMYISAPSSRAF